MANFNREIARLINYINDNATKFLEENFSPNELKIKLVLKGVYRISEYKSSGKTKYYITPPVYKLAVENHYCPRKNLLKNLEDTLFYHYLIFGHENAVSEKAVHFFQNN